MLRDADLRNAELSEANFTNADLTGANLGGVSWESGKAPKCEGLKVDPLDEPTFSMKPMKVKGAMPAFMSKLKKTCFGGDEEEDESNEDDDEEDDDEKGDTENKDEGGEPKEDQDAQWGCACGTVSFTRVLA